MSKIASSEVRYFNSFFYKHVNILGNMLICFLAELDDKIITALVFAH